MAAWRVSSPQPMDKAGDGSTPSVRYGHGAVAYGSSMVVTHGYYFDTESGGPVYLDDTWAFDASRKRWSRWETSAMKPCGRFWHSVAAGGDAMYAFGGTDGGRRSNDGATFVFGPASEMNDLWRLPLASDCLSDAPRLWERLHGGGTDERDAVDADGRACPRKRHLAGAAAAGGRLWVFGGLAGDASGLPDGLGALGDLWSFSDERGWALEAAAAGGAPAARYGHGMVADGAADGAGGGAFLVAGGRERHVEDEDLRLIFDDLWRCDVGGAAATWTRLGRDPLLRRTEAAVARVGREVVVYGGNVAEAMCADLPADGALFDTELGCAAPLPVAGDADAEGRFAPYGRRHATCVAVTLAEDAAHQLLLLFGGESTDPFMYHGSVFEARLFFPGTPERAASPGPETPADGAEEAKEGIDIEQFASTNLE